jgi:hypothetical protein
MAVKLNSNGFRHAKMLVQRGRVVADDRDAWSEHQPSAAEQNELIRRQGIDEYARWHLGVDDAKRENTKGRYKFPYGDFDKVHRCAVLAAESRAGQRRYLDIERAVAHLHGMIDRKAA